jgi:predicted GIY-YIG superfamily endonuclease
MSLHTKIYVLELKHNKWYVGSTYRELYDRLEEHELGYGSIWTRRHGYKRLLFYLDVSAESCCELEDKLTEVLMHKFGIENVRGGNYVNCRPDCYDSDWWYPASLRFGNISTLHYRPVSKFPLELGRLLDAFETFRRFQNSDQLHPEPLAEAPLCGVPEHDEHVLPGHLVEPPLGAE